MRKPMRAGGDPQAFSDRARGVLLGLCVGDALGAPHENRRLPVPPFPQLCDGPLRDPIGGGPNRLLPGQVTDEAQLGICLGLSLREIRRYDAEETARRYATWRELRVPTGPTTSAVLDQLRGSKGVWNTAAKEHWIRHGKQPCDNGSLVRTAPIGVFLAREDQPRAKASLEDSALTHYDPRCQLACAALNGAIARALTSPRPPTADELFQGASTALSIAAAALGSTMKDQVRDVLDASAALKADLELARKPDPQLYGPDFHLNTQSDHVRVAFRLAFWEAAHAPSFEAGLIDVANRGGDSDGNGAVAGALMGALHGESQLPDRWRKAVLEAPVGPHEAYHPRNLLPLVDA